MNKALKLALRIGLSVAVSAVFVWLSLRKTDLHAVGAAIADADRLRVLIYMATWLVIHVVRAVRWGILLEPLGKPGFRRLNSATAVGFMLLMVLPLRLGEFARPLLIARSPDGRGPHLRRSGAMASIVVERIVDGLFVGVLGVVALRMLGARVSGPRAEFVRHAATLVTGGFLVLCVALALAFFLRAPAVRLVHRLLAPVSHKVADKAAGTLDAFISALHLGSGWKAAAFFGLTVVYWFLTAWGLWYLAPAFGMSMGPLESCTLLAMQVVGVMVPAGPGMLGTFQFFTQAGLELVAGGANTDVHRAAYANTVWLLQFTQQCGLGLIFLMLGHVSLRGVIGPAPAVIEEEPAAAATGTESPKA